MLSRGRMCATIPVQDPERARRFYEEKLRLTHALEDPAGVFYEGGGGTRIFVFPSKGTASGAHTQAGFEVDDIDATVNDLKSRVVVFEEYDMPGFKTENSIATTPPVRAAWFRDPDGNMLGVVQFTGS
jgi:catechol 2,3-dioxygenase-like lactoylglutathione lyase family enzyme